MSRDTANLLDEMMIARVGTILVATGYRTVWIKRALKGRCWSALGSHASDSVSSLVLAEFFSSRPQGVVLL